MRRISAPLPSLPGPPDIDGAALCVLASGSAGNCSVLAIRRGGVRRLCLIDLGLSPRRTRKLLTAMRLDFHHIDDVILTHLDTDHLQPGWATALPRHVTVRLHYSHARHLAPAWRESQANVSPFEDSFSLRDATPVRCTLASHDAEGSSVLRLDTGASGGPGGVLGFATDIGRATARVIEHLLGVDVLAIESNYCPRMQIESDRPENLKRRIMGGRGHLSNQEAIEAISRISPRRHVVLLHLSRQCNAPHVVSGLHDGAPYGCTVASQESPTPWIAIERAGDSSSAPPPEACVVESPWLWSEMGSASISVEPRGRPRRPGTRV